MIFLKDDIYFSKEYISLYVDHSKGEEIFEFEYKKGKKIFRNISIKRPIPFIPDYYDLETAYGYGGYLANTKDFDFIKETITKYSQYCKINNIIAEFIRFHPFNDFPKDKSIFEFLRYDRDVVYVDLTKNKCYQSSLKRNIKKAKNYKLNFLPISSNQKEKYIDKFIELYYATMERKKAASFYFFSKKYFIDLFKLQQCKLYIVIYNDIMINAIIILESSPFIYYHLGATKPEFYSLNTNPFIFDKIIDLYKSKSEFRIFCLGGGNSGDKQDPLFKFKKKFSPLTKPFYIAGKIFNAELYEFLKRRYKKNDEKFLNWR